MFKTRNNNNEQKITTRTVLFTHVYGVKDLKKKTNAVKTFKENTKRERKRERKITGRTCQMVINAQTMMY